MSLLSAFEHLLGGNRAKAAPAKPAPTPSQTSDPADARTLLGLSTHPTGDGIVNPVYAYAKPTMMHVAQLPQPQLQMYGDVQGNRWLEDNSGNRLPVTSAPQRFDAPSNSSYHDPLRPGQTGPPPVSDGVLRTNTLLNHPVLRRA